MARASLGLLLDFDGTLSEIVPVPSSAELHPGCATALERLIGSGTAIAIVSGRAVADLRRRLPFSTSVWLSGVHGAELAPPGDEQPDRVSLHAEACRALESFATVARGLAAAGVVVEDKRTAVAAHVRGVPRREIVTDLIGLARRLEELAPVSCVQGKCVVELRARETDKGTAVHSLLARWGSVTPVAIGDDTTDEEMFAEALRRGGLAIKVGTGPSLAPLGLADVEDVARFLDALADEIRTARG